MILRTELRRSTAPVAGIGLLVLTLGLIYLLSGPWWKGTAPWHEQWTGLAQWTRYLTVFLWPLVIGAGAWQGLRDRRSRITELLATTPKPAWRRALPTVGALALTLTGAYVVVLVVGGVQVAGTASYFHLKWLPVAGVMVLTLVGIGLLGVGIGKLLPSLLTPLVLVIAALATQISLIRTGRPQLLSPAFEAPDITVFTTVAPTVTLAQALWFAGIGATGLGLVVAASIRGRLTALLPVALAAAVAIPMLSGVAGPVVADQDARALVCDDNGPRVCVTRAHADYLPTFVGPARTALAQLRKLPTPPTSVVEVVPDKEFRAPSPDIAPVFLAADAYRGSAALLSDPEKIELNVLAGAGMPMCEGDAADWDTVNRRIAARTVVAAWFTGKLRPIPGYQDVWETVPDLIQQAWQELRALPAAEQQARVVALRDAARECRGDLLTILGTP